MKYYTYAHKEIAATSINAYLKVCKANGTRYASIQDETGKKVAWVNSQFGLKDKFFEEERVDTGYGPHVKKLIEDRIVSCEEHDNAGTLYNHGVFNLSAYIVKNFGEIDHYREVRTVLHDGQNGGFEHIFLKNGFVIGVSKDWRISDSDGSYVKEYDTLLTCHSCGEDKINLLLHYSPNERFLRKASGNVIGTRCGGAYSLHKLEDEIIDTSVFQH